MTAREANHPGGIVTDDGSKSRDGTRHGSLVCSRRERSKRSGDELDRQIQRRIRDTITDGGNGCDVDRVGIVRLASGLRDRERTRPRLAVDGQSQFRISFEIGISCVDERAISREGNAHTILAVADHVPRLGCEGLIGVSFIVSQDRIGGSRHAHRDRNVRGEFL